MSACLLLASCSSPDGEIRRYGPYRVGDIYESTSDLFLLEPGTERARLVTPRGCEQADEMEAFAGRTPLARQGIPRGTRIELISIYRVNQSSWNNGISHAHRHTVRILTESHSNGQVRADGFFVLLEGRGGRPADTPLRLVDRPDE